MFDPNPKIEPLINDLKSIGIGNFLKTSKFKRFCIAIDFDQHWRETFNRAEKNRIFYSVGMDTDKHDSEDAFILVLNELYQNHNDFFYEFLHGTLALYRKWLKKDLDLSEIIEDIQILKPQEKFLLMFKDINEENTNSVPKSDIPKEIWNSKKLDEYLLKMDDSIRNSEFSLTLTYSYSCLEGLFKTFIAEKIPDKRNVTDLSQLSKIVRDYLKQTFKDNEQNYPELMLNLISTITNAISNARNSFSESHFDKESEKWLAEFSRDCVNSIGRLIITLIKK